MTANDKPMDREYLKLIAKEVEARLPDNHGFIVFSFPMKESGRMFYISNGQRADCIKALKEWLFQQGEKENWMEHII